VYFAALILMPGKHRCICAKKQSTSITQERVNPMSKHASYWKANLRLVFGCLVVWFLASFVFGILFAEQLNTIRLGGYKLGFWFSQQGSIYTFVALTFFYAWRANKLDHEFGVRED